MKVGRRNFVASTVALAAAGDAFGAHAAPTSATDLYPSYNTSPIPADASGMASTAVEIAGRIKLGWNAGNTMEALGGETAWGNPLISQKLINRVKEAGFDAVRLPCAWDQYASQKTAKISRAWLNRVRDVVQYCMNADLHVLLNIHWDGGWLENHVDGAHKSAVIAKQRAFWEQIATHLRDFDERLMFASANEPNAEKAEQAAILLAYHQTFIDTVRATGGRNTHRVLVIQAPNTSTELAASLWKTMPADTVAGRLMLEAHFYTPYQFTLMSSDASWGRMFYYWGKDNHSTIEPDRNATWGEEAYVDKEMSAMKDHFTSRGVPVVMGEYGAMRRGKGPKDMAMHNASITHWMKYVTRQALANGVLPFLWDVGGVIDRRSLAINDPASLKAMLEAAGKI